jgi:hypothetical protein
MLRNSSPTEDPNGDAEIELRSTVIDKWSSSTPPANTVCSPSSSSPAAMEAPTLGPPAPPGRRSLRRGLHACAMTTGAYTTADAVVASGARAESATGGHGRRRRVRA